MSNGSLHQRGADSKQEPWTASSKHSVHSYEVPYIAGRLERGQAMHRKGKRRSQQFTPGPMITLCLVLSTDNQMLSGWGGSMPSHARHSAKLR